MAHNQHMMKENAEKWNGKVRIIGASIDNDAGTVKSHVDAKGWGDVEHYHVRNGTCKADQQYGVQGVPHCLLVNAAGKIVWVGHPAERKDLVQDFNDMLEGKTPEGITMPTDDGDAGEAKEVEGTPVDDALNEAIEKFKTSAQEMMDANKDKFMF